MARIPTAKSARAARSHTKPSELAATTTLIYCYAVMSSIVLLVVIYFVIALTADHSPLTVYVDNLKRVYQTPPTTWLSLPNCKHIKLAMTNEKGTRHTREPDKLIEHRVKGGGRVTHG